MSVKKSNYINGIHVLFKVHSTGEYTIGTAGIISQPKLPENDNIQLLDNVQKLFELKTKIKIRVENMDGKKKVIVATIHGYSKKPTGRVEMEKLKTDEESKKSTEEVSREKAKEEEKKKAEEKSKKRAEEESIRKAEEESIRKAEEEARKRAKEETRKSTKEQKKKAEAESKISAVSSKRKTLESGFQRYAKNRLIYHDEPKVTTPPSHTDDDASESDSQKDMFLESTEESDEEASGDGSDVIRGKRDLEDEEDLEDDDMSLFHKSSFGCSNKDESDGKCNSTAISIRTATRTVANVNDSSLMENSSTPSRRQQMTDFKDRINDLEKENGFLHYQIDEKDAEIESLKTEILELKSQHNPDNLVERINAALSAANGMASNERNVASNQNGSRLSTSMDQIMVQLVQGHPLKIKKYELKFAMTIGRLNPGNLHSMVNKIMESIYTRIYMSEHSLLGLPPRGKKLANTPPAPVKPALPTEDVVALTLFCITCWKNFHRQVIKPNAVRVAIRSKLSTETRAMLSAMNTPPPEGNESN